MRKLLVTAVALAPLALAAQAHAQTTITNKRTTPVETAGNDVRVAASGTVEVTSGAAITLNSDDDVTVAGGVVMTEASSNSTGILVEGGNTGSILVTGSIRITDRLTESKDQDGDGDLDGPFAEGTNRSAIRITGPGALDGDIRLDFSSNISVEGNQSAGVLLGGGLTGDFFSAAGISITGTDTYGIRTTAPIEGDARVGGAISARGENAIGVAFDGDVDGQLLIDATISASGFRYTSRPIQSVVEKLDDDDLLLGGPALRIGGNIGQGVVLDIPTTLTDEDNKDQDKDLDKDGVPDRLETAVNITSIGSAPAVLVGSANQTVTLGVAGTGDNAYGLINRGTVAGIGVYDDVAAVGMRIGGAGAQAVVIDGGVRNEGTITASSVEANSTAVVIGRGASTPAFVNTGSIGAQTVSDDVLTATTIRIENGADVGVLRNSNLIQAQINGERGIAIAVSDQSGSLSEVENSGRVIAQLTRTIGEGQTGMEPITGRGVAFDLSANTTGVTLTQFGRLADPDSKKPDTDGDGVSDGDEPLIQGDILLGSGADFLDIRNGEVNGGISFGAGADRLRITGGARVTGALANADGQLQIEVMDGVLHATQSDTMTLTGLTIGGDGALLVTVNPDGMTGGFNVNGTARIEDGAGLGVRFDRLVQSPGRYSIIRADVLEFGDIDEATVAENSPYLFMVNADADLAAGEVFIDVRRRTAAEADLNNAETGAFDAVYQALDDDDEILKAFLSQTTREGFLGLYEQMLPDHSGGPLMALATGVDAVTRALSGRNQTARAGETSAWLQEINFYAEKDQDQAYGFESEGIGLAGGIERGTRAGAFGISTAFTSTDLKDNHARAEERVSVSLIELGLYWRAQGGAWTTWARAAGGYAWLEAQREFVGPGIFRSNQSKWDGYTIAAAAGASYERTYGRYSFRPEITAEYFSLSEEARTESGGGNGFDLGIDERDGHLFSATAVMNFGMTLGSNNWLRPELRLGWRQNISFDGGVTTGRFLGGGPDFILHSDTIEGGGPIVGFRMNIGDQLGFLSIEGDAEFIDDYVRYALLLRASFRF